jgi:hypothetical protein
MAAPVIVAGSLTAFGAASGTSLTLNKPSGLQVGDVLVVAIRAQGTIAASTEFTKPATGGWVRATPMNLASDRAEGIYYKPIADAAALTAEGSISNYAFSGWTSGRAVGVIFILRGVDLTSPIAGTSNYVASSTLGTWTPSLPYLAFGLWGDERTAGNSHVPTGTPADLTVASNVQSSLDSSTSSSRTALWLGTKAVDTGGTAAIAAQTLTWASPSGVRTVGAAFRGLTTPPSGSGSGAYAFSAAATGDRDPRGDAAGSYAFSGVATGSTPTTIPSGVGSGTYQFDGAASGDRDPRGSASGGFAFAAAATGDTPTPTGFPSVDSVLAQLGGATIVHRDIATNPKACQKATHQGVMLGHGIIEFSCGWTSDLVPFMLGEQYLDTQSQVSGSVDPKTMTWAFLQANYQITLNAGGDPQPYWSLEDAIQEYPDHVFCVDPKYGNLNVNLYVNAMLDILDEYGGPDRFIVKFDSPGATAIATLAHSRGYIAMNYWGTDTTAMASQQSFWDLIGARFDNSTAMTQANSYGKPSWAFPIDSQANYDTAVGNGADLVMVRSLSVEPVPYDPGNGIATGSYAFDGAASGESDPEGSASGGFSFAATATGDREPEGTATGGYLFAASASGEREPEASAAGSYLLAGSAVGDREPEATSSGGYGFAGAASGEREPEGTAAAGYAFAGVAIGLSSGGAIGTGSYLFDGAASGDRDPEGRSSGGYGYAGVAQGETDRSGSASGAYAFAGVAVGSSNLNPGECWPLGVDVTIHRPRYAVTASRPRYAVTVEDRC